MFRRRRWVVVEIGERGEKIGGGGDCLGWKMGSRGRNRRRRWVIEEIGGGGGEKIGGGDGGDG